ncbi:nitroreductase [Streptomyces sp. NPDC006624]|uniref:nitroreductase n=1 Tax=Streptomyces sp. NPDC006624 TaxID=3154892 RepID=UPI00339DFDA8
MEHPHEDRPVDLVAALAHARSAQRPGPDTSAGAAVRAWPGPPLPIPRSGPADLDLGALLRLSLAASDDSGRLRPAPSAGALHPVDTELVVGTGCSLPPGRYGYDPLRHRVHHLGRHPDGTPPGVTARLTVTARRTVSHYGHRAWPLLLLDTGHAAAALYLAAHALGTQEPDVRLDGLAESPLAAVHIPPPGDRDPAHPADGARTSAAARPAPPDAAPDPAPPLGQPPDGLPASAELLERRSTPPPLSEGAPAPGEASARRAARPASVDGARASAELMARSSTRPQSPESPPAPAELLARRTARPQSAEGLPAPGEASARRTARPASVDGSPASAELLERRSTPPPLSEGAPAPAEASACRTARPLLPGGSPAPAELLARRSTPPPLPGGPSQDALRAVLGTAVRASTALFPPAAADGLRWSVAVGPPRPGLAELAPDGTTLRRYAAGEARPALAAWAAGQAWIADAGAVLLAHGCPADADAAHIRRTHLVAGFAVHLAHVTALRHGLAARPVGSWQQADLGAALGAAPGRDWVVHALALGTRHADEENTT